MKALHKGFHAFFYSHISYPDVQFYYEYVQVICIGGIIRGISANIPATGMNHAFIAAETYVLLTGEKGKINFFQSRNKFFRKLD